MDAARGPTASSGQSEVMKWLYLISSLLSLLGGFGLFLACCLLWRRKKDQGLLRQLLQVALADMTVAIFTLVFNCFFLLGVDTFTDGQCEVVIVVYVWIKMNSILYSMILALGILMSCFRVKTVSLRCAAWLAPLLSLLLAIPHMVQRGFSDPSWPDLCFAKTGPAAITGVSICVLFVGTVVLHSVVLSKSYGAAPHSVVRRVARHGVRYLLAFVSAEAAGSVFVVAMFVHPHTYDWTLTPQWHHLRDITFLLAHLAGFFNFLAFLGHAKGMRKRKRQARTVAFRDEGLNEVLEASHGNSVPPDIDVDSDSEDPFIEEIRYSFSFHDSRVDDAATVVDDMPSVLAQSDKLGSTFSASMIPDKLGSTESALAQFGAQAQRLAEDGARGGG